MQLMLTSVSPVYCAFCSSTSVAVNVSSRQLFFDASSSSVVATYGCIADMVCLRLLLVFNLLVVVGSKIFEPP